MTYNLAGTLDGLTLLDETIGTEKHNTDLASFQVHAHALDARGEPMSSLASGPQCQDLGICMTYSTSSSA